jgi:hypothetical protein
LPAITFPVTFKLEPILALLLIDKELAVNELFNIIEFAKTLVPIKLPLRLNPINVPTFVMLG